MAASDAARASPSPPAKWKSAKIKDEPLGPPPLVAEPTVAKIIEDVEGIVAQVASTAGKEHSSSWHSMLRAVKRAASRKPELIVAVIGASGAGKSSLVNALLGETVVPTSSVKACTSMPIKIAYHDQDQVLAHIEFISKDSWVAEMRTLLGALGKVKGLPHKLSPHDEGKQAWQRAHALYPDLSGSQMLGLTAEQVVDSDESIVAKLGTKIAFSSEPAFFLRELQDHLRSGEAKVDLWPLVAQVSIWFKAPVLASGVTLVDLPGVLDVNEARGAISKEYVKNAHSVLVVAHISRAATDGTAHDLLALVSRSQLSNGKIDAGSIAFVATRNDEISCQEIVNEFELWTIPDWVILENERVDLMAKFSSAERARNASHQVTPAETQRSEVDVTSFVGRGIPQLIGTKRAPGNDVEPSLSKKQKVTAQKNYVRPRSNEANISVQEDGACTPPKGDRPPAISVSIAEVERLKAAVMNCEQRCIRFCQDRRIKHTSNLIQEYFQEALDETGDMDPEEMMEDKIKVFAVSSKEYFLLQGKANGATELTRIPASETLEQTGIPAVVEFCRQIGTAAAQRERERHATQLSLVVGSLESWISAASSGTRKERRQLQAAWTARSKGNANMLSRLSSSIQEIVDETTSDMLSGLEDTLLPRMKAAASSAGLDSSIYFKELGDRVRHWNTLRAILRRDGAYREADWNAAAVDRMSASFATTWSHILGGKCLEEDLRVIEQSVADVLEELENACPPAMQAQLAVHKRRALDHAKKHCNLAILQCQKGIHGAQVDISRKMTDKMAARLHESYQSAKNQSGTGASRMAVDALCKDVGDMGSEVYTSIVDETIESLRSRVNDSLRNYAKESQRIGSYVESHISPVWKIMEPDAPFEEREAVVRKLTAITTTIQEYEDTSV